MRNISSQTKRLICYVLLLLSALAFFFVNRYTGVKVSDDILSQGIAERWNAALPAGFTKESAEHITEDGGYNFARLVYEKDVANYLKQWAAPTDEFIARFNALLSDQLSDPATTEADAALIERARPTLDANWLCFSLQDEAAPENEIMLCYQRTARTMIVAERQVKDTET